jgi:hypothetical protein
MAAAMRTTKAPLLLEGGIFYNDLSAASIV